VVAAQLAEEGEDLFGLFLGDRAVGGDLFGLLVDLGDRGLELGADLLGLVVGSLAAGDVLLHALAGLAHALGDEALELVALHGEFFVLVALLVASRRGWLVGGRQGARRGRGDREGEGEGGKDAVHGGSPGGPGGLCRETA